MPRPAADEDRPAGGAIPDVVARDRLDLPAVVRLAVIERHHDQHARYALRHAVLGEAAKLQVQAVDAPGPEALARLALEAHLDPLEVRQPLAAVDLGDRSGQPRPGA